VFEWTTGGATGEVAEFLTGTRTAAHVHRSLQVVLFADIAAPAAAQARLIQLAKTMRATRL